MPYKVEKRRGARPWKIVNQTSGQVVGSSTTKTMALQSAAARYAAIDKKAKDK